MYELFIVPIKVEQINANFFLENWRELDEGEWYCNECEMKQRSMVNAEDNKPDGRIEDIKNCDFRPQIVWFILRPCQHDNGYIDTYLSSHQRTDPGWLRPVFPGGHPSKYLPRSTCLNFSERATKL